MGNPMTWLWIVTCHRRSYDVTCYST